VVSPVLATANTAVAAVDRLKERGAKDIRLVCLLPRRRAWSAFADFTLTCRCGSRALMKDSTTTALSCRA
jgi:uracil phosphoribosyltransferase